MEPQSAQENILGAKKLNYDFLLLVRDKKYAQALALGRKILSINPDNPSVQKFCRFIEKNNSEIIKMVQRQKQEEQYESVDEGQQDQQSGEQVEQKQGEDEKQQQEQQSDQNEDEQQEDEMEEQQQQERQAQNGNNNTQKRQKIQLTTCTLNQIPHICPRHHREGDKQ